MRDDLASHARIPEPGQMIGDILCRFAFVGSAPKNAPMSLAIATRRSTLMQASGVRNFAAFEELELFPE